MASAVLERSLHNESPQDESERAGASRTARVDLGVLACIDSGLALCRCCIDVNATNIVLFNRQVPN